MQIDAHHHFWKYSPAEYGWIGEGMETLRRDFLPADLEPEIHRAGIGGVVGVQARQSLEETEWLLRLAAAHPFMRGVVGWAPLIDPRIEAILESLAPAPLLKGIRHVLHDEPDPAYMLRADFNRGVAALRPLGLAYDILIFENQLPHAIEFASRHPHQTFVLDHIAKPRIRDRVLSPWRENIFELARRDNVYCKVSGMVTEADWSAWTPAALAPYFDVVLEAFGPRRLMFGSDWPVCLLACDYGRWHRAASGAFAPLSPDERERIFGGTAIEAYHLSDRGETT